MSLVQGRVDPTHWPCLDPQPLPSHIRLAHSPGFEHAEPSGRPDVSESRDPRPRRPRSSSLLPWSRSDLSSLVVGGFADLSLLRARLESAVPLFPDPDPFDAEVASLDGSAGCTTVHPQAMTWMIKTIRDVRFIDTGAPKRLAEAIYIPITSLCRLLCADWCA